MHTRVLVLVVPAAAAVVAGPPARPGAMHTWRRVRRPPGACVRARARVCGGGGGGGGVGFDGGGGSSVEHVYNTMQHNTTLGECAYPPHPLCTG